MKTILVPTDFSANAVNALSYAATVASQTRGKLILVHVVALPMLILPEGGFVLPPVPEVEQSYVTELKEQAKALKQENSVDFEIEAYCLSGGLNESLLDLIKTCQVDLVVMGTKGASNFIDKHLGTNTASFIKKSPVPVLVIPAGVSFQKIKRIAYASDFETEESVFLEHLFAFADIFDAEVNLVNIKSDETLDVVSDSQILNEITACFSSKAYSIAQLKSNDIVEGIWQYVADAEAQVLAISLPKRDFVESLFHKSVSKQLVFESNLPLLTLPDTSIETARAKKAKQNRDYVID